MQTVAQLKKQAKNLGIRGYSRMKKTQLINAIALYNGSKKSSVSKTTSQAAKTLTSNNYNVAKFNKWAKNIYDKVLSYRGGRGAILTVDKANNQPVNELDKNTETLISYTKLPSDSLSIVMYTPYKGDPDFVNSRFVKLSTCMPTCSNHGIFQVEELDNLINMSGIASTKCPFCSENFKFW